MAGSYSPNLLGILVAITALGVLTFVAVTMTSFVKLSVILFLVRNALGIQQTPPNLVLYGIALLLTGYIMAPVATRVADGLMAPDQHYQSFEDFKQAGMRASGPMKGFMLRFTSPGEREFFKNATRRVWDDADADAVSDDDMIIVVPSFVLSELRKAFEAGFLLYLPFIAVDLIVTAVLLAMGMSAVSPTTISVPFKLFLFVAVEGWTRLIHGFVLGYAH